MEAQELSAKWHGRPVEEIYELYVNAPEGSSDDLAILGELEELRFVPFDHEFVNDPTEPELSAFEPLDFTPASGWHIPLADRLDETTFVVADPVKPNQLLLVGGDQELNLDAFLVDAQRDSLTNKEWVMLGWLDTIAYRADKHHLEDASGKVEPWEHRFCEFYDEKEEVLKFPVGERPMLAYDTRQKNLLILGGTYTIEDIGLNG